ncbi:hypothetical protein F4604DRAFT_1590447, partial [Suillus subluteus]
KPEMKDEDYDRTIITTLVKSYWRNLSQQVVTHMSAEKTQKLTNKQINSRCCGRHQTVTSHHRKAIPEFERTYGYQGSAALIDTDYGSDILSCDENNLSADTEKHCKDQNQGKGSWRVVGLEWWSSYYTAFVCILDEIYRCSWNAQGRSAEPAVKCRKVTKPRDKHKTSFNTHPSDMSPHLPKSGKSTVLFNMMVNQKWLHEHKDIMVVEVAEWLKDLYKNIHDGDLAPEDKKYLDNMEEWYADEEDNGSN